MANGMLQETGMDNMAGMSAMGGMLGGQAQAAPVAPSPEGDSIASGRFNGVLQSDNGPIKVTNGVAVIENMAYFVSDDGTLAADKDGNLVAVIIDGKVVEPTPEIIDQLKQEGKIN